MARHKQYAKERNKQLTDYAGLREMILAHKTLLRTKPEHTETKEEVDPIAYLLFCGMRR